MLILKTEGRVDPLGIDLRTPEFSWVILSEANGVMQASYRLIVRKEASDIVWDSGEVFSDNAIEIPYEGIPLEACTRYHVELFVTDHHGNSYSSSNNYFETGLMLENEKTLDPAAKWIGGDELTLDAASACYFDLRMDMTLMEGCKRAGIIFGANDFRLKNKNFNLWGRAETLNYFKYELDVEPLLNGTSDTARLNIYVVGMPVLGQNIENSASEADFTVELPNTVITLDNIYQPMHISIDTLSNVNQVTFKINGITVDENRQLNPLGNTHDYNTYPNLNEIGFFVPAGEKTIFENVTIHNPGPYSDGILFGEKTGATYDIFKGLEGVHIQEDGKILVGGSKEVLAYANPSYGSAPMLRTEFSTEKEIERARLYVTAHGIYEMWLNGERISDHWFNPGNSEYRDRIAYHTYDIKELLTDNGRNAIAVQLAEGWWSGYQTFMVHNYNFYGTRQALMSKVVIQYTDKTIETIVTDEDHWSYFGNGPVEYGSFFQGERYNANKEVMGWKKAGFHGNGWRKAVEIPIKNELKDYCFITRLDEPIGVIKTISSKNVQRTSEHTDFDGNYSYVYDMGENVLGVPHIEIPEGVLKEGQTLIIRYAEILYPSQLKEYQEAGIANMLMVENYRAALSTDFYTTRDSSAVVIEPHRTYHGFRFIELTGLSAPLPVECVKTLLLSSIRMSSTYETSNTLVNRLYKNIQNSQNSNFISLPTDCPQRNERLGWTGDAQVFSMAASYNSDVYNFYRQWLYTLRDSQLETGALPVFAPSYIQRSPDKKAPDKHFPLYGVTWDAALVLIPYNLYKQYGKKKIIRENISAIDKYLSYLMNNPMIVGDRVYNGLTSKAGLLADWLSIEATDHTLINNAVYAYLLKASSSMAEIIGDTVLYNKYKTAYEITKSQWNMLYVDEDGYTKDPQGKLQDTQASYATPLKLGVFHEKNEERAVQHYIQTIKRTLTEKGNYTIKTGFSGTPSLVPALSKYGLVEEAYRLFESTEYASWLYPVVNGATSIWERWNSYTVEGGFNGNNSMNSFNHFSLGAIFEWMMGHQLGIMHDEKRPGYKHFILQPQMGGNMTYAKGSFESPYGQINSGWTRSKENLWDTYEVKVPANTTADLYIPIEGDLKCDISIDGVIFIENTTFNRLRVAHFKLVSGSFRFNNLRDRIQVTALP